MKFALVALNLPPTQSVLATMLYRLLQGINGDEYCLLSVDDHAFVGDKSRLPGKYFHLKSSRRISLPLFFNASLLNVPINAFLTIFSRARQIKKIAEKEGCEAIVACTADFNDLPAAYLASKWLGIPLVLYLFDDYAYQWTGVYRKLSTWLEPIMVKHASKIIVTNEGTKKEYFKRYGVESFISHNPCPIPDLNELDQVDRYFNVDDINIVYAGGIYHAHYDAFQNLVAAIKRTNRSDIKLHLFVAQSESELQQQGISGSMIIHHGCIDQSEVPGMLRQSTILFLPLAFKTTIPEVLKTASPGKMGEYLSVARPVLVHAPADSFVCWYFKQYECGLVVDKDDVNQLFDSLARMIEDSDLRSRLSRNARERACLDFDQDIIRDNFVKFLGSVVDES